jgi:large subunit ribosomal protein L5
MQDIRLEKVVANMGIGPSEDKQESAKQLLKKLTGRDAAHTTARKRFPAFGIKQGQVIGVVVTLRGREADAFFKRALDAVDGVVRESSIANNSVNFGVKEYIYFSGVKYDPKIGMLGLNVNALFARKGSRVERRRMKSGAVGRKHRTVTRDEIASLLENSYKVKVSGGE